MFLRSLKGYAKKCLECNGSPTSTRTPKRALRKARGSNQDARIVLHASHQTLTAPSMGNEMGHALVLSAGCKGSSYGTSLVHDAVARMEDANLGVKGRGSAEGKMC